jgi:DNA-binding winged helix-turn-helix (wHTH) protein
MVAHGPVLERTLANRLKRRFLDFYLNTDRQELTQGGEAVQMQPVVFDLGVRLIENRSRVVPKDELIEVVWRGRVISDGSLNSRVNAARRAWGALTRSRR